MTRIKLPYVDEFLDRHGHVRRYVRRPGFRRVPLPGLPGSEEFMLAYQRALADHPTPAGAQGIKAGSIDALIVRYLGSAQFKSLANATRRARRNILENFRRAHGDKRVVMLGHKHVRDMVAAKIDTPAGAKTFLKTLRGLMRFAVEIGMIGTDPTLGIRAPRYSSDGHATWTEQQIACFQARHPLGSTPRMALSLALFTGQRRADLLAMGKQHVRDGCIHLRQRKTGAVLQIPILPELQVVLDAVPKGALTFIATGRGTPYSAAGFTNAFRGWCADAELPKGLSVHGLRKAAARRLAEAGATTHQIMAITGHRTLSEVERYTRAAGQKRLAESAMATVEHAFPSAPKDSTGTDDANPK